MVNHDANAEVLAWLRERRGGVHPDLAGFVRESGEALGARFDPRVARIAAGLERP